MKIFFYKFILTFMGIVDKTEGVRMADVAQLVRALVCGTRCREFESHYPPHKKPSVQRVFL